MTRPRTGSGVGSAGGSPAPDFTRSPDTAAVERYLRDLVGRCDSEIPVIDQLRADQLGTWVGAASIARAALCWLLDGEPDATAARLRAEILETDALIFWRIRQASLDISAAPWWPEYRARLGDKPGSAAGWIKVYELNARRHRRPRPWTPAQLGREVPT
jgi:hypothetical protein